jgi:hypothetical protein
MRSENWLGRFWSRLHAGMVQDVPPSLEECETCREVDCTQERWEACERRLATEATHPANPHHGPARTSEQLPGQTTSAAGESSAPAGGEEGLPPRSKKISVH